MCLLDSGEAMASFKMDHDDPLQHLVNTACMTAELRDSYLAWRDHPSSSPALVNLDPDNSNRYMKSYSAHLVNSMELMAMPRWREENMPDPVRYVRTCRKCSLPFKSGCICNQSRQALPSTCDHDESRGVLGAYHLSSSDDDNDDHKEGGVHTSNAREPLLTPLTPWRDGCSDLEEGEIVEDMTDAVIILPDPVSRGETEASSASSRLQFHFSDLG